MTMNTYAHALDADEIAAAVRFLSSPAAEYITGQVLGINGGYVI